MSGGTPLAPGDTAPVWTQAFENAAAGTGKLLIPAGSVGDGNGGKNYAYTFVNDSTGVIDLRAVTISADPKTKTVGAPDPSLSYQITNGSLAIRALACYATGGADFADYLILEKSKAAGCRRVASFDRRLQGLEGVVEP